jgi:putative membrane protein
VVLASWFGLAAAASILKHAGFTMRRTGEDLRVSRGLLDRREGSMPIHRLQAVRVQQSIVRRALGLVEVVLQSGGQATSARGGVSRIDVPILASSDLPPLLAELLAAPPPEPETFVAAPPAARRRAIVRRVVPSTVIALGAAAISVRTIPVGVLLVVANAANGELAYRSLAHAWQRDLVLARSGGVARETVIVPAARAQSTRLRSTPLQRRAGLATLWIDVAGKGRTPSIRDGDAVELRALQEAVLLASPAARVDEEHVRLRVR